MAQSKEEIFTAIKEQLSGRGIDEQQIKPEAKLQDDLGLDSLDAVEMASDLEERFGIEIPDDELENVETIGDTIDLIEPKVGVA